MVIFEACSFQDITGQRIAKVVETLQHIEDRVARFAEATRTRDAGGFATADEAAKAARAEKLLLHGPQLAGQGVSQADVDSMLNAGTPAKPAAPVAAASPAPAKPAPAKPAPAPAAAKPAAPPPAAAKPAPAPAPAPAAKAPPPAAAKPAAPPPAAKPAPVVKAPPVVPDAMASAEKNSQDDIDKLFA